MSRLPRPLSTSRLLTAAIVVLTLSIGLPHAPADDDPSPQGSGWAIVAASGQVDSRRHAAVMLPWHPALRGQTLADLSWVRTGPDGRVTLTRSGHILIVDPGTEIQLVSSRSADAPARVQQKAGSAEYRVRKGQRHKFQVITPYLVAGVKGTVFRVEVADGFAAVDVTEGVVAVWSRDERDPVDLFAGDAIRVDARPGLDLEVTRLATTPRAAEKRAVGLTGDARLDKLAGEAKSRPDLARDFGTKGDLRSFDKEPADGDLLDEMEEEDERSFFLDEDTKALDDDLKARESELAGGSGGGTGGKTSPQQTPDN